MKKSHYIGIIAVLIGLNLLVFSCQSDSSIPPKNTEVAVEEPATDTHTDDAEAEQSDAAIGETSTDDAEKEEEVTETEKEESEEKEAVAAKKEAKQKPATMNTPAAPPRPKKPATPLAKFNFDQKEYNFGTVAVGTKVEHDFYFTNTGKVPMIITDASSTCGCTIPEVPSEPIPPGGRSKVKVTFDSTGKIGMQDKHVTIVANTYPKNTVIHMKGLALTENMMPKKQTKASPSPYASPSKLSEPTPKKEEAAPANNTKDDSSLIPTSDTPTTPTETPATTPMTDSKETTPDPDNK